MSNLKYAETVVEPQPGTTTAPVETIPSNPNDPFGVGRKIIEEIEEIGRRYSVPRK